VFVPSTSPGTSIVGNYVGTNAAGTASVANNVGVEVEAPNVTVGGLTTGARNIISGNTTGNGYGIWLNGNTASNATIQGNYIGTNVDGTASIANNVGIEVLNAPNAKIGGTASGARNLVSGNSVGPASIGVHINGIGATGAQIQGNYIGTNANGNGSVPNRFGVRIENAPGATIGGPSAAARNVISGNTTSSGVGIIIIGATATNTVIQGNYIGVAADGSTAAPNIVGIASDPSSVTIGGTGAGEANVIAQNSDLGVDVVSGTRITIRGNSIYSNGGLGIDLGEDGLTANDTGDGDTGANNLQNFPVLTSAVVDSSGARVSGTLNSVANTTFTIDLYDSPACDASGNGEGQIYLGSTSLSTNGSGNGSFSVLGLNRATRNDSITATATDPNGNTSEFSACQTAGTPAVIVSPTAVSVTEGGSGSNFTVRLNTVPTSTVTVNLAYNTSQLTISPTSLTFQPNASALNPQTVTVGAVDDNLFEGTHTSTITLTAESSDGPFSNPSIPSVTATITDNEATAGLSIADASAAEPASGTSTIAFTVTLSPPSASTVTVQYATASGMATGGASCGGTGVDFVNTSGSLSFSSGETSKTVPVTICPDTLAEGSEAFTLTLSNASNSSIARATATGTIQDDDVGGAVQLSAATYSAGENDGTLTVTFQRVTGVASSVAVQYATSDGTAKAGQDYTAASGTLTFGAGESVKTISIPILPDSLDEPAETFTISLSNVTGGAALGTPATATVTINDVDTTPCKTTLSAEVPVGSTTLPVVSQQGCAIGDHVSINPGGSTEERAIIMGFGSIIIDQPTKNVHHTGEVVVKIGIQEDLGRAVVPPEDNQDKPQKLTEEERQQRQRTNRLGQDDYRTEGNVVEVRCDAPIPTMVVANRDGNVELRLLKDAAPACGSIKVGDYLEAEGEKQNEQLYDITDLSVKHQR
jgi:hypothetical protein